MWFLTGADVLDLWEFMTEMSTFAVLSEFPRKVATAKPFCANSDLCLLNFQSFGQGVYFEALGAK